VTDVAQPRASSSGRKPGMSSHGGQLGAEQGAQLVATNLVVGYGAEPVLRGVDIRVDAGEIVALLGANGAGKTTTLLALAGVLKPTEGVVHLFGAPTADPLHIRARKGLAFVAEDRSLFMKQSVADNLRIAKADTERVFALFPELAQLRTRRVGALSGGEQQMLTLARALSRNARLILIDELSLGLAPLIVERLLDAVRRVAHEESIGVLLVEQHVEQILEVADRGYVLQNGTVAIAGTAAELTQRHDEVEAAYLTAVAAAEAKGPE
jgi:branched-chain amino acid transport system ATP-binding protein